MSEGLRGCCKVTVQSFRKNLAPYGPRPAWLRPTESEIYALTHRDIAVADDPKRLLITVRKGKTGQRITNTMPGAVSRVLPHQVASKRLFE
jgi:hypothetical protein